MDARGRITVRQSERFASTHGVPDDDIGEIATGGAGTGDVTAANDPGSMTTILRRGPCRSNGAPVLESPEGRAAVPAAAALASLSAADDLTDGAGAGDTLDFTAEADSAAAGVAPQRACPSLAQ